MKAIEPETVVRIFNTNTNKVIEAHVPVRDGKPVIDGDFAIDGVPGTGARLHYISWSLAVLRQVSYYQQAMYKTQLHWLLDAQSKSVS